MGSPRFWLVGMFSLIVAASAARAEGPPASASQKHSGADVRELTELIDRRITARWAEAHVKPVQAADDAEFLRRVSLDLIGRIATVSEVRDFLDDPAPDKRARSSSTVCWKAPGTSIISPASGGRSCSPRPNPTSTSASSPSASTPGSARKSPRTPATTASPGT